MDFQKPLVNSIFVGLEGLSAGLKGYEQKLECKGVLEFCQTCHLQGHDQCKCKVEAKKIVQAERKGNGIKNDDKKDDDIK